MSSRERLGAYIPNLSTIYCIGTGMYINKNKSYSVHIEVMYLYTVCFMCSFIGSFQRENRERCRKCRNCTERQPTSVVNYHQIYYYPQWGWRLEGWTNTAARLTGWRRVTRQAWFFTADLFRTVPVVLQELPSKYKCLKLFFMIIFLPHKSYFK